MFTLICTSYNRLEDGSLQLRNNWIEYQVDDDRLKELAEKWKFSDLSYTSHNSISDVIEGEMDNGCPIHIRIVRF